MPRREPSHTPPAARYGEMTLGRRIHFLSKKKSRRGPTRQPESRGAPSLLRVAAFGSLELLVETALHVLVGLERERALPARPSLREIPLFLEEIAEVLLDGRVIRIQDRRGAEVFLGLVELVEPVVNPAEGVEIRAVTRLQLDGLADELERSRQVLTAVRPHVAEIVEA